MDVTNHLGSSTVFSFPTPIGADEADCPGGCPRSLARSTNATGYGFDIADVYWAAPGFDDQVARGADLWVPDNRSGRLDASGCTTNAVLHRCLRPIRALTTGEVVERGPQDGVDWRQQPQQQRLPKQLVGGGRRPRCQRRLWKSWYGAAPTGTCG